MTDSTQWSIPAVDPDFEAKRKAKFEAYFEKSAAIADAVREEAAAEGREVGPLDTLLAIADAADDDEDDEPNLYMTDPGRWAALSVAIPGLLVESAGGACPYQSEGTIKGYPYYFRYRNGSASLKIGMPGTKPYGWDTVLWDASKNHGDDYDGFLEPEEFANLMIELVPHLSRSPRTWQFTANKIKFDDNSQPYTDGERESRGCVHDTIEEAAERILEGARSGNYGLPDYSHLLDLEPVPGQVEERVWPDPEPLFETTVNKIAEVYS